MKVNKFNEEIEIRNFSDMENWSPKKKVVYTGTKKLDLELGHKAIDVLKEYGLGITSVGSGNGQYDGYLRKQELLLPDEVNLKEYRVNIGKKDWDNFLDNYEDEHDIKYDKLSEEEQEVIDEIFNKLPYESDPDIEFSVFLPSNVTDLEAAAMSDASVYLQMLSESELRLGYTEYDVFFRYPEEVKKFVNLKKIQISNKNLEIVNTISNRLYKDNKAIAMFYELLGGEYEGKKFFNDWLKIM